MSLEMVATLLEQTGYLAGGFALNLVITVLSMMVGTALGAGLGQLRFAAGALGKMAGVITNLCRNVPSFVLMFYLAFMLPVEFEWNGTPQFFPVWIKATLALTFPVIGFASDQFLGFRRQVKSGTPGADLVFLAAWVQYALIILMASVTASVVGTDEILSRANQIAWQSNDPIFLVATYVYTAMWFLAAGLLLSGTARRLARRSDRHRDKQIRSRRRRRRKNGKGNAIPADSFARLPGSE